MRYLTTVLALALCACGPAGNVPTTAANSSTNVANSANSSTSSNVTTSTTSSTSVGGTSSTTSSTTTSANGTSSCSADSNGRRCDVTCNAPKTAQCIKGIAAADPTCICK